MPRKPKSEIRLKCANCKDYTHTINPIIINKLTENRYHIKRYVQFVINLNLNF